MARQKSFHARARRASLMGRRGHNTRLKGTKREEEGLRRLQNTRLGRVRGDGARPQPTNTPNSRATFPPTSHPPSYPTSYLTLPSPETQITPGPLARDRCYIYSFHRSQKMPLPFPRKPRRVPLWLHACKAAMIGLLPAKCFGGRRRREEEVEQMLRDNLSIPHPQTHPSPNDPVELPDSPDHENSGETGNSCDKLGEVRIEERQKQARLKPQLPERITTTTELTTQFEQLIMAELGRNVLTERDTAKGENPNAMHDRSCTLTDPISSHQGKVTRALEHRMPSTISEVYTGRTNTPVTRGEMICVPRVGNDRISFSRRSRAGNENPLVKKSDPVPETPKIVNVKERRTHLPERPSTPAALATTPRPREDVLRALLGEVQRFVSELEGSLTAMAEATHRQGLLLVERMEAMESEFRGARQESEIRSLIQKVADCEKSNSELRESLRNASKRFASICRQE